MAKKPQAKPKANSRKAVKGKRAVRHKACSGPEKLPKEKSAKGFGRGDLPSVDMPVPRRVPFAPLSPLPNLLAKLFLELSLWGLGFLSHTDHMYIRVCLRLTTLQLAGCPFSVLAITEKVMRLMSFPNAAAWYEPSTS